jgi:hypothetical protein
MLNPYLEAIGWPGVTTCIMVLVICALAAVGLTDVLKREAEHRGRRSADADSFGWQWIWCLVPVAGSVGVGAVLALQPAVPMSAGLGLGLLGGLFAPFIFAALKRAFPGFALRR